MQSLASLTMSDTPASAPSREEAARIVEQLAERRRRVDRAHAKECALPDRDPPWLIPLATITGLLSGGGVALAVLTLLAALGVA